MKKIALLCIIFITTFMMGCDFLSGNSAQTDGSSNSTTDLTDTTFETTTFEENKYIDVTPNTDDVSYEDLFDDSLYKKMTIYFSKDNFVKLINDMEDYFDIWETYRDNTIQEVDIVYEDGNGNIMQMNEVGFRTKGNIFSRVLPATIENGNIVEYFQTSFQLEFNETFNYIEGSTEYNYLKSREGFDLEQLNFKYIKSGDFGVVTESVAYDLFREAGVITSNTSYTMIYLNVEGDVVPYGLYMMQEPIDDVFAERYYGKNEDGSIGDVYKCTWQHYGPANLKDDYYHKALGISDYLEGYRKSYAKKTNKDYVNFDSFTNFIELTNNINVNSYYASMEQMLMIDNFAKASAMHFLVGSPDDYRSNANNYYMYFNEGKAYYMPFDFDNSLGYGWNPYDDYGTTLDIGSVQPANDYKPARDSVLIYNLLKDLTFRNLYFSYLELYTREGNIFSYDRYVQEYITISNLYYAEILSTNGIMGINYFDISQRYNAWSAEDYFTQKISSVRLQLTIAGVI